MIASALYKGNGGGPAGRDFAEKFWRVNKGQTIWLYVGRVAGIWNALLSQQNQPTRRTTLYVPLLTLGCLEAAFGAAIVAN